MKSIDWADIENYRNKILVELMEFCMERGLDTVAKDDTLTVKLPTVADINVWSEERKRKVFNIADWGPKGVDENEITNLPDNGEILDEGVPPQGDPSRED